MTHVSIKNLSKTFTDKKGAAVVALSDFSLEIDSGEFVTIVGPSGCGKTTALRILQGLETKSAGSVVLGDVPDDGSGSDRGFVFQQYGLLPWKTARQNIIFALQARGIDNSRHEDIVRESLTTVGLANVANNYPRQMSGGMQQRVGIARALAVDPDILLLDEPFGALDALTREILQTEMLSLSETMGKTIVFVTHSIDEAILLADKVVVMAAKPGRIDQVIPIDLGRPRSGNSEAIRESSEFAEYRHQLWELLMEKYQAA